MRAVHWLVFVRALCLLALGTSVALLVDYTSVEPSFCGVTSGCGAVRLSGFGYIPVPGLGRVPVPVLGVLAFGLLFASTLQRTAELRERLVTPLAYASAASASVFLGLQAYLGSFCSLCVTVDVSAILIAAGVLQLRGAGWFEAHAEEEHGQAKGDQEDKNLSFLRLRMRAWFLLGALAMSGPLLFPHLVKTSEVPTVIRALYAEREVTALEFFDFQCPHCQDLSPRLKSIAERDAGVVLRFGYTPLPGHDAARDAARTAICAGEQDRELAVVGALFERQAFAREQSEALAKTLVPDGAKLSACLRSTRPDARISRDTDALKQAQFVGLPTTYIGGTRVLGAREDEVYLDAIRRAKDGSDRSGLDPWVFWLAMLSLGVVIVATGRAQVTTARTGRAFSSAPPSA